MTLYSSKPWWQSNTLRGLLVTAAGMAAPPLAKMLGADTPTAGEIADFVGYALQLAGLVAAAWGRIAATKVIS